MERDVADLATAQWGLVTTSQAKAIGVNRTTLNRLAAAGVLVHLAHGVYALRTSLSDDLLQLRAAWLTLDPARLAADRLADPTPTAVISYASAAQLHGYGDLLADRHEFTVTTRKQTRRLELRLHRGDLPSGDITLRHGLPVTTPARTVLDLLTAHHDGEHVADVLADAVRDHQVDLDDLAPRLGRFARRFGLPAGEGAATLTHLLELGDVNHEVEATALATLARMTNLSMSTYIEQVASTLAQQKILEVFAQLGESVNRQMDPAAAMMGALQKNVALRALEMEQIQDAVRAASALPLQQIAAGLRPLQAQVDETLRALQIPPSTKAALEQYRSPQLQEQIAAVHRAVQP